MKVSNIIGENGRPVENQFVIDGDDQSRVFQSYKTVIVKRFNSGITALDVNTWRYSRTTIKYRNMFLNEDSETIERKVKEGTYQLMDLNK